MFRVLQSRANAQPCIEALAALRSRAFELDASQILRRRFLLWLAQLGALDQAFEILTQSLDHFARKGSIGASWTFLWMPELLDFRRDPRFQLICRRMGLFEYWNVYGRVRRY